MTEFVLLPGAWRNGRIFDPVVPRIESAGRSAVAHTFPATSCLRLWRPAEPPGSRGRYPEHRRVVVSVAASIA